MDIKRVAFETKSVSDQWSVAGDQLVVRNKNVGSSFQTPSVKQKVNRKDIAAIVDRFLSQKIAEEPKVPEQHKKAVIHQVESKSPVGEQKPTAVEFVSENDVRDAVLAGTKIYISKTTIVTPSAKDLGEEKEIFARV
jgi:ethanolamine utilization cobalamin adenosyltransferase